MLRLLSSGPKSRTTAGYLSMFLGWAGIHKFYLGYRNAGIMHAVLTGVGVMVLVVQSVAPASVVPASIVAWVVILIGYFYIRRVRFGHTIAQIISPGRLLRWPLRLLRHTFRVGRAGYRIRGEEERERRLRQAGRRRRGGRYYDDDDNGGFSFGMVVIILGIALSLAVVVAIVVVYYVIFSFVGFAAVAGSITIGVIEGALYFTKSDQQFQDEYVVGRRLWF